MHNDVWHTGININDKRYHWNRNNCVSRRNRQENVYGYNPAEKSLKDIILNIWYIIKEDILIKIAFVLFMMFLMGFFLYVTINININIKSVEENTSSTQYEQSIDDRYDKSDIY